MCERGGLESEIGLSHAPSTAPGDIGPSERAPHRVTVPQHRSILPGTDLTNGSASTGEALRANLSLADPCVLDPWVSTERPRLADCYLYEAWVSLRVDCHQFWRRPVRSEAVSPESHRLVRVLIGLARRRRVRRCSCRGPKPKKSATMATIAVWT